MIVRWSGEGSERDLRMNGMRVTFKALFITKQNISIYFFFTIS